MPSIVALERVISAGKLAIVTLEEITNFIAKDRASESDRLAMYWKPITESWLWGILRDSGK